MTYALRPPASADEWKAFHDIRRVELFEAKGRIGVYDPDHPDDLKPENRPFLLTFEGRPVGAVRLDDFGDGTGAVRLVAVTSAEQGKGHGRVLMELVDGIAQDRRMHTLYINSAPTAVGFYAKGGWEPYEWSRAELIGFASDCIQMRKVLGTASSQISA